MANKIDKLTPEQEAQIAVYRSKGLQIGLNTDPLHKIHQNQFLGLAASLAQTVRSVRVTERSTASILLIGKDLRIR